MLLSRRQALGMTAGGLFAFAARQRCDSLFGSETSGSSKRCIVLWMEGGPSQLETFDLKSGTRNGGDFQSIATSSPEIRISQHLPLLSKHMDKLSVLRNLSSSEGDHGRGSYYMHTGFTPVPSFPRPTAGSVVSKYCRESDIPKFVTLGGNGVGPAFMGPDHAPFTIDDPNRAKQLMEDLRRRRNRLGLVDQLSVGFREEFRDAMVDRRRSMAAKISRIVTTPFVDALDLEQEPLAVRERYGENHFGKSCLLARRLIESGVHFVEVQLGGWDTHNNNFQAVRELSGQLDRPWAALMQDLHDRGMLDDTIVLWMGEFGRTPTINAQNGRDHFPDVTPVVIGGGGIAGGRAIGKTSADGTSINGPSVRVADLFATLFHQFEIKPDEEFTTSFDSPTQATDGGNVIEELLG